MSFLHKILLLLYTRLVEKAVLRTLAYADVFDCAMESREVHKWLIGRGANLSLVDKTLRRLAGKSKIGNFRDYYYLSGRKPLAGMRTLKVGCSLRYLNKAKLVGMVLRIIPWILLVGVSGNLAVKNSLPEDDIDLFIITRRKRLWLSRIFVLGMLELMGKRRKRGDTKLSASGKVCVNMLLEEDSLSQLNRDIYVAHEVLQMKVLWERGDAYQRFLKDNDWVFKYLPNWKGEFVVKHKSRGIEVGFGNGLVDFFESLARRFQIWYMKPPLGKEVITSKALCFHPHDYRMSSLNAYRKRLFKLALT